jgi:hypothetical protein
MSDLKKACDENDLQALAKIKMPELGKARAWLAANNQDSKAMANVEEVRRYPHALHFAQMDFFATRTQTELETREVLPGLYRLYRPSLKIPSMFTVGLFHITVDPATDAVLTREERHFRPRSATGSESPGMGQEKEVKDTFTGYIFRKRRRYICTQTSTSNTNFLFTVFSDEFFNSDTRQIASLAGVAFGSVGARVYTARVFIERCEDNMTLERLREEIDYKEATLLPPSVERNLRMPIRVDTPEYFTVF